MPSSMGLLQQPCCAIHTREKDGLSCLSSTSVVLNHIRSNRVFTCKHLKCTSNESAEGSSSKPGYGAHHHHHQKEAKHSHSSTEANLLSKLSTTLHTRKLLLPQQKVLVAVSGGQDSISLIFLLKKLQHIWGWKLGIVYCDHQWSPSSRPQASHIAQIACHLGFDYYQAVATRSVAGESTARTWRYGILHRIASSHGYSAIVTAHTGSDRVETLLHNLFRGTGLHGLLSLTWKRWITSNPGLTYHNAFAEEGLVEFVESLSQGRKVAAPCQVALVRPLLDFSRMELRQYCDLERLPLWPDPSNFSMDIRRNKIRHQLLPFLRKNFQASIDKSLTRWAEILCGEDAFLEDLCESIRKRAESSYSDGWGKGTKLDIGIIRALPVAVQRRVIKQFVEAFSNRSLGFDHVENLRVTCLVHPCKNGIHFSLPGNVELQFLDDNLLLHKKQRR